MSLLPSGLLQNYALPDKIAVPDFQFQIASIASSLRVDMITATPKAIDELGKLLARKAASPRAGLRLAVRRGGCAGWQYEMRVADPEEGDEVIDAGSARIIVAHDSLDKLRGCEIDYSDDLTDAGFKIHNPQAARSCGCGTSFETAADAGTP